MLSSEGHLDGDACRHRIHATSGTVRTSFAHHGPPEIPIAQRCALLVTVFEGEHNKDEVASNPMQIPLDGVPHWLIQGVQRAVADCTTPFSAAYWRVLTV